MDRTAGSIIKYLFQKTEFLFHLQRIDVELERNIEHKSQRNEWMRMTPENCKVASQILNFSAQWSMKTVRFNIKLSFIGYGAHNMVEPVAVVHLRECSIDDTTGIHFEV